MLGQRALPFLVFWGNSILFSTVASTVCIPTNSALGFPFLRILSNICLLICLCLPLWWETVPHCGFNLHLSDGKWCWASFHMSLGPLYVLLGEMSVQVFCPFINWVICLPGVESCEFFIYFGDQALVWGIIGKYVSPYCWFSFYFNAVVKYSLSSGIFKI